tara:strand:+ start:7015 stop:7227 length:213 start_codon:yes stop_codon:yes gene_type:complete
MVKDTETVYHFYAKDECILHSVKEEDFRITWITLKAMVGLMHTSYKEEDLSYTEVKEMHKEKPSLDEHSY